MKHRDSPLPTYCCMPLHILGAVYDKILHKEEEMGPRDLASDLGSLVGQGIYAYSGINPKFSFPPDQGLPDSLRFIAKMMMGSQLLFVAMAILHATASARGLNQISK